MNETIAERCSKPEPEQCQAGGGGGGGAGGTSKVSVSRDPGIGACAKQKDAMLTAGVRKVPWNLMNCIQCCTSRKVEAGKLCPRAQGLGILVSVEVNKQKCRKFAELGPSGSQQSSLNLYEA